MIPDEMRGVVECPRGEEGVGLFELGQRVRVMDDGPVMYVTYEVWNSAGLKNLIACLWFGPTGQKHTGTFDHRLLRLVEYEFVEVIPDSAE